MNKNSSNRSLNPFGSVFTVLGILMGAASLISLVQRWTDGEIVAEIARDALSIYRQMMDQFHWALFSWWTPLELAWGWVISMPLWGMDLLAIWLVSVAAVWRTDKKAKTGRVAHGVNGIIIDTLWVPFAPYVVLWWIFTLLYDLPRAFRGDDGTSLSWRLYIHIYTLTIASSPIVLAILFFVWNAIQLSPQ